MKMIVEAAGLVGEGNRAPPNFASTLNT